MIRLFVSIRPDRRGGGSNSFAYNFVRWAKSKPIQLTRSIHDADAALVIAHCGVTPRELEAAKSKGCRILHRIDEHFGGFIQGSYLKKHQQIAELNRYADITVFQSRFVEETAGPVLKPERYEVILNGGDEKRFSPARISGTDVGHVTWSVIEKKRLDLVANAIEAYPGERFRLVGNQGDLLSTYPSLHADNVRLRGTASRRRLPKEYRAMKILYFPSMNDPCPNTVVEAILAGVPVCYHPSGGTPELVRDCGEPLENFDQLLANPEIYRKRCLAREDLCFDRTAEKYYRLLTGAGS